MACLNIKFELSEEQVSELKRWQDAIFIIYKDYGSYTFIFHPTGIGEVITVECDIMGNKHTLDLTDVDSW
jgi:hypothetical protein